MKLNDQVPSLELCKKLKELGYPQRGLVWWAYYDNDSYLELETEEQSYGQRSLSGCVAPTVAEMGERLPSNSVELTIKLYKMDDAYFAEAMEEDKQLNLIGGGKEVNIRAEMLIYLAENRYIDFKKI